MEKSKKMSFTSIAIVVLAILLTVSLTMGGTLAWFANQNQAGTTLTMGNAVGVAVVDKSGENGSMDRLSFQFNTGRNGELMLPGTQVDPDVRAIIARSNTNVILRAVVTFEVTVNKELLTNDEYVEALELAANSEISDDGYIVVPSSIAASLGGATTLPTKDQPVQRELFLLNKLYTSFFSTLQRSALFNGWVYRESNVGDTSKKVFEGQSAKAASQNYYVAGKTQYSNIPIKVARNAGLGRTQYDNTNQTGKYDTYNAGELVAGTKVDKETVTPNVTYNAFYFRGWSNMTKEATTTSLMTEAAAGAPTGYTYEAKNRGIDGVYRIVKSNGSIVREEYMGGGRNYYPTRDAAVAGNTAQGGTPITDPLEYPILEGTVNLADNSFTRSADTLGYREGDYTGAGKAEALSMLNRANGTPVNGSGNTNTQPSSNLDDCWQTSGVTSAGEDMMCVLNTNTSTVKVPLFTTSFILPTDWTQDAFADRSMRLNITFQVMQADYLASGTSHHCSVELAESRFDDVTIWYNGSQASPDSGHTVTVGQPYVKNVANQPDFDNPAFWGTGKNPGDNTPDPAPGGGGGSGGSDPETPAS